MHNPPTFFVYFWGDGGPKQGARGKTRGPKTAQEAKNGPQDGPRGAQDRPRRPQDDPRGLARFMLEGRGGPLRFVKHNVFGNVRVLGCFFGRLGPSFSRLGPLWGRLGPSWDFFLASHGRLGPSWGLCLASWAVLGPFFWPLGPCFGLPSPQKWAKNLGRLMWNSNQLFRRGSGTKRARGNV